MNTRTNPTTAELLRIYELLLAHFGPLHWWPAQTPFEVMVGAILTQNTAWSNVEKAIAGLKAAGLLSPQALARADMRRIKRLIRPSGYFNQKAIKLKAFVRFFMREFGGSMERMAAKETAELRAMLLAVKGIGPETADSILLYALGKPVFMVDAYTRRAFHRLGFLPPDADYHSTQAFFLPLLPVDVALYNEFHAQIVYLGKDYCRPTPRCPQCPLSVLRRCKID
jgi:endonuclease-3 related protein